MRILPDGCIDILVDCARGEPPVAVGTMTRALVFVPRAPVRLVAVRFRPGGAVPFLRASVDALTDTEVTCADLGVSHLIPAGLGDGEDLASAAMRLEQSLLSRLNHVQRPDPRVRYAVRAIARQSALPIERLASEMGWTRQHFTRTIRAQTGVSPKQLARTLRLQRAVTLLQRERAAKITEVAAATGYFDQAHMAADFRELVGVPPRNVRDAKGSIFPIPSLFEEA